MPLLWALSHLDLSIYGLIILLLIPFAIGAAHEAGLHWGHPDDPKIVIDESVGMGIAAFGLMPGEWLGWILAFIAFRLFDIVKPWPASYFDRCQKNGFGVVMDDVMAGVYALLLIQGGRWVWLHLSAIS